MDYNVLLKVKLENLSTVLEVLKDNAEVVKIDQIAAKANKTGGYLNGKKNKGISGFDLVLATLASGPKLFEEIEEAFVARGFAASSTSPSLSKCRDEKRITFDTATEKWRKI